ncbi:MAG: diguanylate cyclase, partial [Clostridium sp.]
ILERKSGGKDYEITSSWMEEEPMVRNDNLKTIPGLIAERYLELFRNRKVLACNRICELEILDPVIAERQKLRKTRALMQFPIMENGDYIGYISVNDSKKERLWTLEETMTFALAGRVLHRILECRFQRFALNSDRC